SPRNTADRCAHRMEIRCPAVWGRQVRGGPGACLPVRPCLLPANHFPASSMPGGSMQMTPPLPRHPRCLPTGAALLEIMIGLAVGLLICATALNALHISRALSEITGDAIAMQQDVTTALRIIGLQIRQAGSAALDLQPALSAGDATQ